MTDQLRESEVVDRNPGGLLPGANAGLDTVPTRSLGRDAWLTLRANWVFWFSAVLIVIFTVMALVPGLITHIDPNHCEAIRSRGAPSSTAWFGYDVQGCDVYSRTIHGARASMLVGTLATTFALVIGAGIGVYAGFYGGVTDTFLSRITDIFIGIPLLVGTIILLASFPGSSTNQTYDILKVALAISIFGWTQTARVARAAVIQVRHADYVQAARCLGASRWWMIRKHIIPNSAAPIIVVTTLSLGGYIGAEAALSFLGIGLQPPVISWGIAINDAQSYVRTTPHMLFFPALFLSLAVLGFIMLGDAVQEALDPKRL
jgi:oligopeptide transport system permease protein